jgi:signal transduction histidine kinase
MQRKILFVDDEQNVLEGLERLLHDCSGEWNMASLSNAQAAMDLLMHEEYDVAVLDINMPGMSGLDLLTKIKNTPQTCDVEVIMLTGLKDFDLKRQALDRGAADLLTKPVLREELIARVNSALRVRSYRDELKARNTLLEQQLLQAQRMELVGALAAGVAHDLRNMLTAMLGHSELTERILDGNATAQTHIQRIHTAGERARKLVEQIVKFTTGGETSRDRCELGAVVTECLELLRPSLGNAIDVDWTEPETDHVVIADPTQMYQVVMNLCLNAAHAMKHGGTMAISLSTSEPADNQEPSAPSVVLDVADTGVGMDEETRERILDPLFSTEQADGGSGLGLSVVDQIVTNHGGRITVESNLGEGTTFSVHLPPALAGSPAALTQAEAGNERDEETSPVRR